MPGWEAVTVVVPTPVTIRLLPEGFRMAWLELLRATGNPAEEETTGVMEGMS